MTCAAPQNIICCHVHTQDVKTEHASDILHYQYCMDIQCNILKLI